MKHSWGIFLALSFAFISCERIDELIGKGEPSEEEQAPPPVEETIQAVGRERGLGALPVSTAVQNVSAAGFQKFIAPRDRISVVKFYADW